MGQPAAATHTTTGHLDGELRQLVEQMTRRKYGFAPDTITIDATSITLAAGHFGIDSIHATGTLTDTTTGRTYDMHLYTDTHSLTRTTGHLTLLWDNTPIAAAHP